MSDALMTFASHVVGRNATVEIHSDRIEWKVPTSRFVKRGPGSEMIPIRSISSVTTAKDGHRHVVNVITSGNTIEFRIDKGLVDPVKSLLTDLMLGKHETQVTAPPPPPQAAVSVADELAKLAALRDAGHLSEDEFAAQKARLLG